MRAGLGDVVNEQLVDRAAGLAHGAVVADGLGHVQVVERVLTPGNANRRGRGALDDLQPDDLRGTTLVELAGRVEVARTEVGRRGAVGGLDVAAKNREVDAGTEWRLGLHRDVVRVVEITFEVDP